MSEPAVAERECPACGWRHQVGYFTHDVKIVSPPLDTTRGVFEPGRLGVVVSCVGDPPRYRVRIGGQVAWLYPCQLDDVTLEEFVDDMKNETLRWVPSRRSCNVD